MAFTAGKAFGNIVRRNIEALGGATTRPTARDSARTVIENALQAARTQQNAQGSQPEPVTEAVIDTEPDAVVQGERAMPPQMVTSLSRERISSDSDTDHGGFEPEFSQGDGVGMTAILVATNIASGLWDRMRSNPDRKSFTTTSGEQADVTFDEEKMISRGLYGVVHEGTMHDDEQEVPCVVKTYKDSSRSYKHSPEHEVDMMQALSGKKHVVQMHGVIKNGEDIEGIIMEKGGVNLDKKIRDLSMATNQDHMTATDAEASLTQVVGDAFKGLAEMHEVGISHKDVKLENFVEFPEGLKVIDFGMASMHDKTDEVSTEEMKRDFRDLSKNILETIEKTKMRLPEDSKLLTSLEKIEEGASPDLLNTQN